MKPIINVEDLVEGTLVCIYLEDEPFNGYILETVDGGDGIITLLISPEDNFDEQYLDIYWDTDSGEILDPEIYLI